jgi:hypothetical protein
MIKTIAIALVCLGATFGIHAAMYKWVDASGVTRYSETPPPGKKALEIQIKSQPALSDAPARAPADLKQQERTAASGEESVRAAVSSRCSALFDRKDFAALSQQIDQYQYKDVRTPSGAWKLEVCHKSLYQLSKDGSGQNAAFWSDYQVAVDGYIKAHQSDRNLPIIYAALLMRHGWAYRGGGYASDVPKDSWPPFFEYIARARKVLDDNKSISLTNPMWYLYRLTVLSVGRDDTLQFGSVFAEATGRFPSYTPIYFSASEALAPKWGGSYEALEKLAAQGAILARGTEGESMYARIYYHVAGGCCGSDQNIFRQPWFDKRRLARAIDDLVTRYPDQWNYNIYAQLSCAALDREGTAKLMSQIVPGSISAAWGSDEEKPASHYARCRTWASYAPGVQPPNR